MRGLVAIAFALVACGSPPPERPGSEPAPIATVGRPLNCVGIGDSITVSTHDDAHLGGWIGRLVDWGLTQGLQLHFLGVNPLKNHIAPRDSNVQWSEAFGGFEIDDLTAALDDRPDQKKLPTGVPLFGPDPGSISEPVDFVIFAGGANNMNNLSETVTETNALHVAYLLALRDRLNGSGNEAARIVVIGGYTDWGEARYHAKVEEANATIGVEVYDVFDAENPEQTLLRLPNWYDLVGPWNADDWDDLVHWKAVGYDRVVSTPDVGMIYTLGPVLVAAAGE